MENLNGSTSSEEETLSAESEVDLTENQSEEESEEAVSSVDETTTLAYEDSIQYDVNYGFGYLSIWLGCIFGALLILAFFKGFKE